MYVGASALTLELDSLPALGAALGPPEATPEVELPLELEVELPPELVLELLPDELELVIPVAPSELELSTSAVVVLVDVILAAIDAAHS
jgi:hypothetical protein